MLVGGRVIHHMRPEMTKYLVKAHTILNASDFWVERYLGNSRRISRSISKSGDSAISNPTIAAG